MYIILKTQTEGGGLLGGWGLGAGFWWLVDGRYRALRIRVPFMFWVAHFLGI
jgi:hypothetical protein